MFSAALSIAGKGRHIHNHVRVTMAIHKARWSKCKTYGIRGSPSLKTNITSTCIPSL